MKIVITGAHFTPAVATIEELKKMGGVEMVYIGRQTTREGDKSPSVESEILPSLGVKFVPIITGRLQRVFTIYTIPSLLKIPIGFIQALCIVLSEKPDVILSFGGYVAVPIIIVGWFFSIPIIIHEQTVVSGLANKISSYFADKIAISFSQKKPVNEEKVILTGNPIRHEVTKISQGVKLTHPWGGIGRHRGLPTILVMGGNQGSHVINLALEQCLDKLAKKASIIHQTGISKFGDFDRLKQKENSNYKVEKFISNGWGQILRVCDLVISRAGINTLTELAYLGKPALIIPIDGQEEQNINAKFFGSLGLIKILPQSKLSPATLLRDITYMLNNLNYLKEKAKSAKKIIIPDGAKRLALETILLAKNLDG